MRQFQYILIITLIASSLQFKKYLKNIDDHHKVQQQSLQEILSQQNDHLHEKMHQEQMQLEKEMKKNHNQKNQNKLLTEEAQRKIQRRVSKKQNDQTTIELLKQYSQSQEKILQQNQEKQKAIQQIEQQKQQKNEQKMRLKKSIYHDDHEREHDCSHCFAKPVIRDGKCIHQNRCSHCSNEDERQRRLKLLERDIEKCQTDHQREELEEKKRKLEEEGMYKASQCLSVVSDNSIMMGHSLHSYCEHKCTPPGADARFKQTLHLIPHACVLIQCHQASGHVHGYQDD